MAWYRMWANNPDLDLSFLEGELDNTLTIWKARLAEKDEIMTYSEAAAKGELDEEVSSKVISKGNTTLDAEVDALMGKVADEIGVQLTVDQVAVNAKAAHQEIVQLVKETLTEAAPDTENIPPPSQS